jgi:hypothetical protein
MTRQRIGFYIWALLFERYQFAIEKFLYFVFEGLAALNVMPRGSSMVLALCIGIVEWWIRWQ